MTLTDLTINKTKEDKTKLISSGPGVSKSSPFCCRVSFFFKWPESPVCRENSARGSLLLLKRAGHPASYPATWFPSHQTRVLGGHLMTDDMCMDCLISKDHLKNSDPFMMCNPLPLSRCLDTYRNRIGGTNNNNKRGKRSKTL